MYYLVQVNQNDDRIILDCILNERSLRYRQIDSDKDFKNLLCNVEPHEMLNIMRNYQELGIYLEGTEPPRRPSEDGSVRISKEAWNQMLRDQDSDSDSPRQSKTKRPRIRVRRRSVLGNRDQAGQSLSAASVSTLRQIRPPHPPLQLNPRYGVSGYNPNGSPTRYRLPVATRSALTLNKSESKPPTTLREILQQNRFAELHSSLELVKAAPKPALSVGSQQRRIVCGTMISDNDRLNPIGSKYSSKPPSADPSGLQRLMNLKKEIPDPTSTNTKDLNSNCRVTTGSAPPATPPIHTRYNRQVNKPERYSASLGSSKAKKRGRPRRYSSPSKNQESSVTPLPPRYKVDSYLRECVKCHDHIAAASWSYLIGHSRKHFRPMYTCSTCNAKFTHNSIALFHIRVEHAFVGRIICNEDDESRRELDRLTLECFPTCVTVPVLKIPPFLLVEKIGASCSFPTFKPPTLISEVNQDIEEPKPSTSAQSSSTSGPCPPSNDDDGSDVEWLP